MKRYGQACPLARALDVVGERWALLVVRELMLGPRRYTDLGAALPGIGTNVLAGRLRDLTEAGVVTRQTLPPPAAAPVYALTEAGRALGPVLSSLGEWGRRYGRPLSDTDAVLPGPLLLLVSSAGVAIESTWECELLVAGEAFRVRGSPRGLSVRAGQAEDPDAVVRLDPAALQALVSGRAAPGDTMRAAEVDGDEAAAGGLLDAIEAAVASLGRGARSAGR